MCYRSSFLRLELPRYRRTRTWRMQTRASRMKARRRRRTTMPRRIDGKHRKGLHAHWAPKFGPNSVHPRIVMPSLCNHNVQTPASSRVLGAPASTGLIQAHRESQALNHHRQTDCAGLISRWWFAVYGTGAPAISTDSTRKPLPYFNLSYGVVIVDAIHCPSRFRTSGSLLPQA